MKDEQTFLFFKLCITSFAYKICWLFVFVFYMYYISTLLALRTNILKHYSCILCEDHIDFSKDKVLARLSKT